MERIEQEQLKEEEREEDRSGGEKCEVSFDGQEGQGSIRKQKSASD